MQALPHHTPLRFTEHLRIRGSAPRSCGALQSDQVRQWVPSSKRQSDHCRRNGSGAQSSSDVDGPGAYPERASGTSRETISRSKSQVAKTVQSIQQSGIVACVRASRAHVALEAARAALRGGITVLEVTCTTPGAAEVISSLVREFPWATIGAGTVLTRRDASDATAAGARFLMSPGTDKELVLCFREGPVLFIPGASTPTEILWAANHGLSLVKLFPAGAAGGPDFVTAMKRAMPKLLLVPAHAITLGAISTYLEAGAAAVVLSDAIFDKSAVNNGDYKKICERAHEASLRAKEAILAGAC